MSTQRETPAEWQARHDEELRIISQQTAQAAADGNAAMALRIQGAAPPQTQEFGVRFAEVAAASFAITKGKRMWSTGGYYAPGTLRVTMEGGCAQLQVFTTKAQDPGSASFKLERAEAIKLVQALREVYPDMEV